jgi:hypothetical protein
MVRNASPASPSHFAFYSPALDQRDFIGDVHSDSSGRAASGGCSAEEKERAVSVRKLPVRLPFGRPMLAIVLLLHAGPAVRMGAQKQRSSAGLCHCRGGTGWHRFDLAGHQDIQSILGGLPGMLLSAVNRWAAQLLPVACSMLRAIRPLVLRPSRAASDWEPRQSCCRLARAGLPRAFRAVVGRRAADGENPYRNGTFVAAAFAACSADFRSCFRCLPRADASSSRARLTLRNCARFAARPFVPAQHL